MLIFKKSFKIGKYIIQPDKVYNGSIYYQDKKNYYFEIELTQEFKNSYKSKDYFYTPEEYKIFIRNKKLETL